VKFYTDNVEPVLVESVHRNRSLNCISIHLQLTSYRLKHLKKEKRQKFFPVLLVYKRYVYESISRRNIS
jgi:hypothetical protein